VQAREGVQLYIEQVLLLVVQVVITLTTAMPRGLAGGRGGRGGASLSALPACSVTYNNPLK
jgi:hypothetical protein